MLGVLTQAPDVGAEAWAAQFQAMRSETATYYILVVVSRETDQIVASGGVFVERKFLRGLGRVGHIEDIAVAPEPSSTATKITSVRSMHLYQQGRLSR